MTTPKQLDKDQEKLLKNQRKQLAYQITRIKGAWSFGKINTFKDILVQWGYSTQQVASYFPSELNVPATFDMLKDFISDRQIEFGTYEYLIRNPPDMTLTQEEINVNAPAPGAIVIEALDNLQASNAIKLYHEANEHEPEDGAELSYCSLEADFLSYYWFQKNAIKWMLEMLKNKFRSTMVVAGTGTGKTFIAGGFFARLIESNYADGKSFSPWPYVYVTKASVVEQTKEVFEQFFNLTEDKVMVINYDALRATFGKRFITEERYVEDGVECIRMKWRNHVHPLVIIWDESHSLKNEDSQQAQTAISYNEIVSDDTFQCHMSATPGTRVADFKAFVVGTQVPYTFGIAKNAPMCNNHWNDFAKNIASNYGSSDIKPIDHSPAAIERLMDYMNKYIYRVKGVKPQFKAYNRVQLINFSTEKARNEYNMAWEKFLAEKAKIEAETGESDGKNYFNILSQLMIFRLAAESNDDRAEKVAAAMYASVQNGKAAVAAFNFKIPIVKVSKILIEKYGVSRDEISLIWGGAPTASKKQKNKKKIQESDVLQSVMAELGISLADLDLDKVEDAQEINLDPSMRLGPQSKHERQKEIRKFQSGKSLYCLFTFRAGGVGLSLHHTDQYTKEKVRHKKSGYAMEADIPSIPTRPREVYVAPTWSAMELVQGLGRCPRINSLSDTPQILLYYVGTIEERVAYVVSCKLKCLSKVVRNHEDWVDIMVKTEDTEKVVAAHVYNTDTVSKDEDEELMPDNTNEED